MQNNKTPEEQEHAIPDIKIVDLEKETFSESDEDGSRTDTSEDDLEAAFEDSGRFGSNPVIKALSHINIHIVLVAVVIAVIATAAYKLVNWGHFIDHDELFKDGQGEYSDTFDTILPLTDDRGIPIEVTDEDGVTTIVAFGNAPFADDRGSKDNLASMIADMTGATVYNCSVTGSYLASLPFDGETSDPINIFNFYWLCHLATSNLVDQNYHEGLAQLGTEAPPEAQGLYDLIKSIDFSKVDVIAVMYDASDYLAGHPMYNDDNATDIEQFTGNLEAGIQLLKSCYPHIRIIVLSPTYAYSDQIDPETGKYISSDIVRYGHDVLSTYVIKQYASCVKNNVTFIDNLYGTVTGANADKYLIDNLHLNAEGRKRVAERFVYALEYYYKKE